MDGFLFTAPDDGPTEATVTATYKYAELASATIAVEFGRGSDILFDFENGIDEWGTYFDLKEATVDMLGHASQVKVTKENTVIATGGSMVFSENAMQHLCESGVVIWLETPVETLEARLTGGSRERRGVAAPGDMSIRDIYALREPLYTKYAQIRIACQDGVENVVGDIILKLREIDMIGAEQAE